MPGEVNVASIEALEALESAVSNFTAKCLAAFEEAEPEIRRKVEELEERRSRCERAAARCRRAYDEADPEEDNLGLLSKQVEEAEDQLRRVRHWQKRVEERRQDYILRVQRAREVAAHQSFNGRAFLRRKINELYEYVGTPAGGGGDYSGGETSDVAPVGTGSSELPAEAPPPLTTYPLPQGYQWVRLNELNLRDLGELPAPENFKGVGYDKVRQGLELLSGSILPAMKQNPDAVDGDHFNSLDRQAGRNEVLNSLQGVYDSFFGGDAVWVDRPQGESLYSIGNGRHRIKAALDLGWDAIPAKIIT